MKLSVGIFFGGFFGALGILFFLVAFGTDYWLLATEVGKCSEDVNRTRVSILLFLGIISCSSIRDVSILFLFRKPLNA